jgi:hypothetical protein
MYAPNLSFILLGVKIITDSLKMTFENKYLNSLNAEEIITIKEKKKNPQTLANITVLVFNKIDY